MDPVVFTSEQVSTWGFVVRDGFDQAVAVDGTPTAIVSDPAVADVAVSADPDTSMGWLVAVTGKAAADGIVQTVTVDVDADLGPDVNDISAFANFVVNKDPRTDQRFIVMTPKGVVDKPR